jgi:pSer/pThr/pTyr-binding forkhead associated (FHA) protein
VEPKNSRMFFENGAVFIEDLNSTNGTYVNGMKIHAPSKLHSNCEIRIGVECFIIKF